MQAQCRPDMPSKVIVRVWGDEPVILFLHRVDTNRVMVGTEDGNHTIGLPPNQVFVFEENLYAELRRVYKRNDRDKLASISAAMIVKEKTCNKYQDKLESSHDKENISDTHSTAGSVKR